MRPVLSLPGPQTPGPTPGHKEKHNRAQMIVKKKQIRVLKRMCKLAEKRRWPFNSQVELCHFSQCGSEFRLSALFELWIMYL